MRGLAYLILGLIFSFLSFTLHRSQLALYLFLLVLISISYQFFTSHGSYSLSILILWFFSSSPFHIFCVSISHSCPGVVSLPAVTRCVSSRVETKDIIRILESLVEIYTCILKHFSASPLLFQKALLKFKRFFGSRGRLTRFLHY